MSRNVTTKQLSKNRTVLLSYNVPVAAFIPGLGYVKTARSYSKTTSGHANKFCEHRAITVTEAEFARLIEEGR